MLGKILLQASFIFFLASLSQAGRPRLSDDEYCKEKFRTPPDPIPVVYTYNCYDRRFEGANYRGTVSVTMYNRKCKCWDCKHKDPTEVRKDFCTPKADHNYCRNPYHAKSSPWCYTTDAQVEWEYCNIPSCESLKIYGTPKPNITAKPTPKMPPTEHTHTINPGGGGGGNTRSPRHLVQTTKQDDKKNPLQGGTTLIIIIAMAALLVVIILTIVIFIIVRQVKKRSANRGDTLKSGGSSSIDGSSYSSTTTSKSTYKK